MGAQCAYHRLDHYLLDICSYPSPKPCIVMWQVQATINCLWNVCVCVYAKSLQLCLILCDPMDCIACQAPLSVEFSRQDYWSRLPRSPLGDIPNSGVEPRRQLLCLLHWQLGSLPLASPGSNSLWNQFSHFSRLDVPNSLQPYGLQHARLSRPSPTPGACSMSIESVMPINHLNLCRPLLLLPFPASGSLLMSQFFTSGGQSIGASASASVLPMNIWDFL